MSNALEIPAALRRPASEERFLTVKQGAFLAGFTVPALYDRIKGKNGLPAPPFVRRGGRILLPRPEFDEWAKQKVIP